MARFRSHGRYPKLMVDVAIILPTCRVIYLKSVDSGVAFWCGAVRLSPHVKGPLAFV